MSDSPAESDPPEPSEPTTPAATTPADPAEAETLPPGEAQPARNEAGLVRQGAGFLLAVLLLIAGGPWLLSRTVATSAARSTLSGVSGGEAQLGHIELGWATGARLDHFHFSAYGAELLMEEAAFETDLISGGLAAANGGEVSGGLVVKRARLDLTYPPSLPPRTQPPSEPEAEPEPTPAPGQQEPITLPFSLRGRLDVKDSALVLHYAPEGQEQFRAAFSGVEADFGGLLEKDLAVDVDAGFTATAKQLVVATGGENPATLIEIQAPKFQIANLKAPAPGTAPIVKVLQSDIELSAGGVRLGDMQVNELGLFLKAEGGPLGARLLAKLAHGGTIEGKVETDVSGSSWPTKLQFNVQALELTRDLAKLSRWLIPLLIHQESQAGPGLPPISLSAGFELPVSFQESGGVDVLTMLQASKGDGRFEILPGKINANAMLDAYVNALLGVGIFGLTQGIVPGDLEWDGVDGAFKVGGGKVRPAMTLKSEGMNLAFTGEIDPQGQGPFSFKVSALPGASTDPTLGKLLQALDRAGGVTLSGLVLGGEISASLPPVDKLKAAASELGVLEALTAGGSKDLRDQLEGITGGR